MCKIGLLRLKTRLLIPVIVITNKFAWIKTDLASQLTNICITLLSTKRHIKYQKLNYLI